MERQLPLLETTGREADSSGNGPRSSRRDRHMGSISSRRSMRKRERDWVLDDRTRENGRRGIAAARAALAAANTERAA